MNAEGIVKIEEDELSLTQFLDNLKKGKAPQNVISNDDEPHAEMQKKFEDNISGRSDVSTSDSDYGSMEYTRKTIMLNTPRMFRMIMLTPRTTLILRTMTYVSLSLGKFTLSNMWLSGPSMPIGA